MKSLQSTGQIYILKHNQDLQSNFAPIYELGWSLAVNLDRLHFCEVRDFIFVKFKTLQWCLQIFKEPNTSDTALI